VISKKNHEDAKGEGEKMSIAYQTHRVHKETIPAVELEQDEYRPLVSVAGLLDLRAWINLTCLLLTAYCLLVI
jgi:hypothetical protein